jgi:hypothetical protein
MSLRARTRLPVGATGLLAAVALASTGIVAISGTATAQASAGAAAKVKCPIKASASSTPVEWAFTESGAPSGAHRGIASSYTHGRGSWQGGKASGTICHADQLTGGRGSRELVLAMAGAATLSPHVTRLGLLGVELALKVKVAASDDPACSVGSAGTVTLFASYFSVHHDSARLRFAGGCSAHSHLFTGPGLHVLISRKGAQVNSA